MLNFNPGSWFNVGWILTSGIIPCRIVTPGMIPHWLRTHVIIQPWIMTRSQFHVELWPGSSFHVELWQWIIILHEILTPSTYLSVELEHMKVSKLNSELNIQWVRMTIILRKIYWILTPDLYLMVGVKILSYNGFIIILLTYFK